MLNSLSEKRRRREKFSYFVIFMVIQGKITYSCMETAKKMIQNIEKEYFHMY